MHLNYFLPLHLTHQNIRFCEDFNKQHDTDETSIDVIFFETTRKKPIQFGGSLHLQITKWPSRKDRSPSSHNSVHLPKVLARGLWWIDLSLTDCYIWVF
ncbi:hypothetical protein JTE90_013952 [Oedothorax gibbosus]|uniref:Uncharacterized protein n=1 Tax=Oedothorax gibbosus TaxID=931172 RepID=A0AAV6UEE1_9ARAC|nr:hypothetical protein JTE90_013952 [Oedothorax gibbosus]